MTFAQMLKYTKSCSQITKNQHTQHFQKRCCSRVEWSWQGAQKNFFHTFWIFIQICCTCLRKLFMLPTLCLKENAFVWLKSANSTIFTSLCYVKGLFHSITSSLCIIIKRVQSTMFNVWVAFLCRTTLQFVAKRKIKQLQQISTVSCAINSVKVAREVTHSNR